MIWDALYLWLANHPDNWLNSIIIINIINLLYLHRSQHVYQHWEEYRYTSDQSSLQPCAGIRAHGVGFYPQTVSKHKITKNMDSFSQDYKEYPRLKVLVSKHKIAKNIDKSFSILNTRLQRLF